MKNSQIMLIGFDPVVSQMVADILSALSFEVHVRDEPFDGLADLIEDPGVWMACVMDAQAFTTDAAFQRYLQLFAFEGQHVGMVLGDADCDEMDRYNGGAIMGVDRAIGDVTDPQQILGALGSVLARRGFGKIDFGTDREAVPTPAQVARKTPSVIKTSIRVSRGVIRDGLRSRNLPREFHRHVQAV